MYNNYWIIDRNLINEALLEEWIQTEKTQLNLNSAPKVLLSVNCVFILTQGFISLSVSFFAFPIFRFFFIIEENFSCKAKRKFKMYPFQIDFAGETWQPLSLKTAAEQIIAKT